jgi:hypothetical protein
LPGDSPSRPFTFDNFLRRDDVRWEDPGVDTVLELPLLRANEPSSLRARVTVVDASADDLEMNEAWQARRVALSDRYGGFRCAPLVRVVSPEGGRLLLVGTWLIWLVDGVVELVASVSSFSSESDEWQTISPAPELLKELAIVPFDAVHSLVDDDPQRLLTTLAKAAAEESRNAVSSVRLIRYGLESRVRASLSADSDESPSRALPALIGLRIAVSQARDRTRECIREGFMLWRDDDEAYQRYRRHRDASIINPHAPADIATRPWIRTHDAGIRQCEAMNDYFGEEIQCLAGMLDSVGTMAMAREAEAADTLNKIASAVALGLGLPSLVLAYYGADSLFDLSRGATAASVALLLLPAVIAVILVRDHLPGESRRAQTATGIGAIFGLLALLLMVVVFTHIGVPEP